MSMTREIIVQAEVAMPEYPPAGFIPEYTLARNTAVAEHIAPLIGAEMYVPDGAPPRAGAYYVPDRPLLYGQAARLGIHTEQDLFGGVVAARLHHDKAIFHPLVGADAYRNDRYSYQFAAKVEGAVLPGYTAFSAEDAYQAYHQLRDEGHVVRWKDPCGEGGNGQAVVRTEDRLHELLATTNPADVEACGLVFEPHVVDPLTLSVGTLSLGGKSYSYYGFQQQTPLEDITTYGGTTLTMMRGDLTRLSSAVSDPSLRTAIRQAQIVYDAYSWYDPILSRTNFDVVQGYDHKGRLLSGVVDQSLRIGGASPAEVLAVEALEADTSLQQVVAQVEITWDQPDAPLRPGDVVFFDHRRRRDVARIIERTEA